MKLTRRTGRWITASIGIACAAALASTATLAASAAPSALLRPAAPACGASSLTVWTGAQADGAAGHFGYELEISNTGHHACSLQGYPGVSVLGGNGHQVGKPASRITGLGTPNVTIPVGGTAHVVLIVADTGIACPNSRVNGSVIKVFAPGSFHANLNSFSVSVCKHRVSLQVDAVHPGAGIPGYSGA
jgi:uncharacterized protein DUF4232